MRSCSSPRLAARFAVGDAPLWCVHPALREALDAFRDTLKRWDGRNRLLREAMGNRAFTRHAKAVENAALAHNITLEQGVILRAYTDASTTSTSMPTSCRSMWP